MKKIKYALLFSMMLLSGLSYGQSTPKFVYCQIMGWGRVDDLSQTAVRIEFGESMKFYEENRMKDASGKKRSFPSLIDAVNFMAKQGWELKQVYTSKGIEPDRKNYYYYVLQKNVDELDDETKKEFLKN